MKFRKILTSILALTMVSSLIVPVAKVDAASSKSGYILWEDFEGLEANEIPEAFQVPESLKDYWEVSIEDGAIKYKLIKQDGTTASPKLTSQMFIAMDEAIELDENAWYQVGYDLKYKRGGKMEFVAGAQVENAYGDVEYVNAIDSSRYNNLTVKSGSNSSGGVNVATTGNFNGGDNLNYSTVSVKTEFSVLNGQTVTNNGVQGTSMTTASYSTAKGKTANVTSPVTGKFRTNYYGHGNYNILKGLAVTIADNAGGSSVKTGDILDTEIIIDNFYVRQVEKFDVTFHLNDGSGASTTESADFDGNITLPTPDAKDGYKFGGWYEEEECVNEFAGTGITADTEAFAKWIEVYTVTFETMGGSAIDPIDTDEIERSITLPTSPTKYRYQFVDWYTTPDCEEGTEFGPDNVTGDITVYAKWDDAYPVTFLPGEVDEEYEPSEDDILFAIDAVDEELLAVIEERFEEAYEQYRFDGWYRMDADGNLSEEFNLTLKEEEKTTDGITIYAKWTKKNAVNLIVKGEVVKTVYVLGDIDISILPLPTLTGDDNFAGWYRDEECTIPFHGTFITDNMNVYAKITDYVFYEGFDGETYNEKFDVPKATDLTNQIWGNTLESDESGNKYMKYTLDDNEVPIASVAMTDGATRSNGTIVNVAYNGAQANNTAEILLDGDTWYEMGYKVDMNDTFLKLTSAMSIGDYYASTALLSQNTSYNRYTYIYSNYFGTDSTVEDLCFESWSEIDGFVDVKALFNINRSKNPNYLTGLQTGECIVTVSYKTVDGEEKSYSYTTYFSSQQSMSGSANGGAATRFKGLSFVESADTNFTPRNGEIYLDDIYLKKANIATVDFDMQYDGIVETKTCDVVGNVEMPTPEREGYEFKGWYTTPDCSDGNEFSGSGVTESMTVYAKWISAVKIIFDDNFAETANKYTFAQTEVTADTIDAMTAEYEAIHKKYALEGWYRDAELTDKISGTITLTEEEQANGLTVYAKWNDKHLITFVTNSTDTISEEYYALGDVDIYDLPTPSKDGVTFEAWYTDAELKNKFDGKNVTEPITLYAKYRDYLFYEDFSNPNVEDTWLKGFAPSAYERYKANGAGITELNSENVFNYAGESGSKFYFDFADMGEGLYELSLDARNEKTYGSIGFGAVYTDENGSRQDWNGASISSYYVISAGTTTQNSVWNRNNDKPAGYVNIRILYNTVNNTVSTYTTWKDALDREVTIESENVGIDGKKGLNGIYLSAAYTGNSKLYIDNVSVRKLEMSGVESITPADGSIDVNVKPEIKITFEKAIDTTTVTADNIWLEDADGNKPAQKLSNKTEDGKTVVTITVTGSLAYETNYKVVVSSRVKDESYFIDTSYESSFKTTAEAYEVTTALYYKNSGLECTNLKNALLNGSNVIAEMNVRNLTGKAGVTYFAGIALYDSVTGMQIDYVQETGVFNETKDTLTVIAKEFAINPNLVNENTKVKFFLWDSTENRQIVINAVTRP